MAVIDRQHKVHCRLLSLRRIHFSVVDYRFSGRLKIEGSLLSRPTGPKGVFADSASRFFAARQQFLEFFFVRFTAATAAAHSFPRIITLHAKSPSRPTLVGPRDG